MSLVRWAACLYGFAFYSPRRPPRIATSIPGFSSELTSRTNRGPTKKEMRVMHSNGLGIRFLVATMLLGGLAAASNGQAITEFPVPPSPDPGPQGITSGPDGNLWFTDHGDQIGRITTGGVVTVFPIPGSTPDGIVAGPDGNLWFTDLAVVGGFARIGRITTAGLVAEFPLPDAGGRPAGIAAGGDGNLWFTEPEAANNIGRITTAGIITEFPIPTPASGPRGITTGPDGNLWFTETSGNKIGRITTSGVINEFPIPTPSSQPLGITTGPDGNLWFTEYGAHQIGRITTAGVVTEFSLASGAGPRGIASGPDGNLWFADYTTNKIGRITTAGSISEFSIPTSASGVWEITTGPDRNLWFTEPNVHQIGRLIPCNSILISAPSLVCAGSSGLIASVPDQGPLATYAWAISGGTITSGAGTPSITFTAGAAGSVDLSVTINDGRGCTLASAASTLIGICRGSFYTLTPCRIADTRGPEGPLGGPALGANTVRNFLLAGQCGIPASARAVALNVTITQPTALGDLRFFPGGTGLPLVSTTNYRAGQTRANNTVVSLGASGELAVRCDQLSGAVHLIIDVNGYFQ